MGARAGLCRGTCGSARAAALTLLQFDLVCRPGEIVAVANEWVHRMPGYSNRDPQVAVVFFPSSRGRRDKAKQQDDTIIVGEITGQRWLGELLAHMAVATASRSQRLMGLDLPRYEKEFALNVAAADLGKLKMRPHGLRHGGASMMALDGADLGQIQTRGRWLAATSVLRYKKHGRYLRIRAMLTKWDAEEFEHALRELRRNLPKAMMETAGANAAKVSATKREPGEAGRGTTRPGPATPRKRAEDPSAVVSRR